MTPIDAHRILADAAGRRAASRLAASWASRLSGYTTAEVQAAVEAHMQRTGHPPRLDQVRALLETR